MPVPWNMLRRGWRHYWRATTYFNVHSPLFFEFCQEVIDDDRHYYRFDELAYLRELLSKNQTTIQLTDFGAGSKTTTSTERTISSIMKASVSPDYFLRTLFRTSHYRQPKVLVELGTSLGLSALALAGGAPYGKLTTFEGDPMIAAYAKRHFDFAKAENIDLVLGNFDDTLPMWLKTTAKIDLAFIDGNHRGGATLRYFEQLLPHLQHNALLIFDDIHWSAEMEQAWEQIKAHPKVTGSIDLFKMGFVFFDQRLLEPKHLRLVPHRYKPWTSGIQFRN